MTEEEKEMILQALRNIEAVADGLNEGNIPPSDYKEIMENVAAAKAVLKEKGDVSL